MNIYQTTRASSDSNTRKKIMTLKSFKFIDLPNVAVEWLTLLLRIPKVPGSNLGPETDYPA
jgi:hypothetical protein